MGGSGRAIRSSIYSNVEEGSMKQYAIHRCPLHSAHVGLFYETSPVWRYQLDSQVVALSTVTLYAKQEQRGCARQQAWRTDS